MENNETRPNPTGEIPQSEQRQGRYQRRGSIFVPSEIATETSKETIRVADLDSKKRGRVPER
jgi:hypothetical protein